MTEKRKIIYVVTKSGWGGAQKSVYILARQLHLSGEYDVLVAYGESELSGENILEEKLKETGIRTAKIQQLKRNIGFFGEIQSFFALWRLFRTERPNAVHLNSSKAGMLGAPAARLARVPNIVFTMRGAPFLEVRPKWQNMIIEFATWLTAVFSHVFVTVSEFEKGIVKKWPLTKNKITHIYNAIESPEFLSRIDARAFISRTAGVMIHGDAFVIGSIAELTDNKGLLEFLPILAERKKQQDFIYVHFGSGELGEELKNKTKELGLEDTVHWLGFVKDASTYLKALDVFTLPSKKEGLPNVLLEAKLAGVAIEASTVGGIPELLEFSEEYIRENLTPAKIAQSYRRVYDLR